MGWGSGTEIFDAAMDAVEAIFRPSHEQLVEFARRMYNELGNNDWDTESESAYYEHILEPIMREKYPHLFDED